MAYFLSSFFSERSENVYKRFQTGQILNNMGEYYITKQTIVPRIMGTLKPYEMNAIYRRLSCRILIKPQVFKKSNNFKYIANTCSMQDKQKRLPAIKNDNGAVSFHQRESSGGKGWSANPIGQISQILPLPEYLLLTLVCFFMLYAVILDVWYFIPS